MAHFFHFIKYPLRRHKVFRPAGGNIFVNSITVSISNNGCIILALCPALNLKGINACSVKVGYTVNHTKVTGIENICTVLVLVNGEILSGSRFLNKMIFPPARLSTISPVGISADHIIGENTPAAERHTHSTVNKGFYLKIGICFISDGFYFIKRKFSGCNDTLCTHIIKSIGGGIIYDSHLSRHMYFYIGSVFFSHGKNAHIGYDKSVHPDICNIFKIIGKKLQFIISGQSIAC